jgi:hypothetical protein
MKILNLLLLSFLFACASKPQLSAQQRRSLQVRSFKATYETAFRSIKTVLQDEGYVIKNQDMQGGLIVAEKTMTDNSSRIWAAFAGSNSYRTGEGFDVSFNLEKINENMTESRLVIQKHETTNLGGKQGEEILAPELYQAIYQKIQTELARRLATGK